jgi:hypothetical protein
VRCRREVQRHGRIWLVQNLLPFMPGQLEGCERRTDSYRCCLHELPVERVIAESVDLEMAASDALIADKAYDTDAIRDGLKKHGIRSVILPKSSRIKMVRYSKRFYREYWIKFVHASCVDKFDPVTG